MPDVFTKAKRSEVMSRMRGRMRGLVGGRERREREAVPVEFQQFIERRPQACGGEPVVKGA